MSTHFNFLIKGDSMKMTRTCLILIICFSSLVRADPFDDRAISMETKLDLSLSCISTTDEDRVFFNELFASFTNLIASVSESTRPGWAGSKLAAWAEQGPETNLAWVPIQGVNPHRPGPRMRRESRYSDEEVRHGRRRNQMARAILLRFVLNSLKTGTDEVVPSEMLLAVTSLWGKDLVEHVDRQGENKCREHRMTDGFSALDSMRAIYGAFRDSDHVDKQTKREVEYILSCLEQKDSP